MSEIEIGGYKVLFDEKDRHLFEEIHWKVNKDKARNTPHLSGSRYTKKTAERGKHSKYMGLFHRLVMNATKEEIVKNKNGSFLDCRKENLYVEKRGEIVDVAPKNWAPNKVDIAFAAGLFDGEGCFSTSVQGCQAALTMTDLDSVQNFLRAVGFGDIKTVKVPENRKPAWVWRVNGFEKVQALYAMIYPWLNQRRRARGAEVLRPYIERKQARDTKIPDPCLVIGCDSAGLANRKGLCDKHRKQREHWVQNKGKNAIWTKNILSGPLPESKKTNRFSKYK